MLTNVMNNASSYSRVQGSQFRLQYAAPLHCPIVLPLAPSVLSLAPSVLPLAPSLLPLAPSLLPLKRPCSLSRPGRVIPNPKFGVYIIYIYIYIVMHAQKRQMLILILNIVERRLMQCVMMMKDRATYLCFLNHPQIRLDYIYFSQGDRSLMCGWFGSKPSIWLLSLSSPAQLIF